MSWKGFRKPSHYGTYLFKLLQIKRLAAVVTIHPLVLLGVGYHESFDEPLKLCPD